MCMLAPRRAAHAALAPLAPLLSAAACGCPRTHTHRACLLPITATAPGISASPSEDNLRYFNVMILGPTSSPYEGAFWHTAPSRSSCCCVGGPAQRTVHAVPACRDECHYSCACKAAGMCRQQQQQQLEQQKHVKWTRCRACDHVLHLAVVACMHALMLVLQAACSSWSFFCPRTTPWHHQRWGRVGGPAPVLCDCACAAARACCAL